MINLEDYLLYYTINESFNITDENIINEGKFLNGLKAIWHWLTSKKDNNSKSRYRSHSSSSYRGGNFGGQHGLNTKGILTQDKKYVIFPSDLEKVNIGLQNNTNLSKTNKLLDTFNSNIKSKIKFNILRKKDDEDNKTYAIVLYISDKILINKNYEECKEVCDLSNSVILVGLIYDETEFKVNSDNLKELLTSISISSKKDNIIASKSILQNSTLTPILDKLKFKTYKLKTTTTKILQLGQVSKSNKDKKE